MERTANLLKSADSWIILAALAAATVLCWLYLVDMAYGMGGGMEMAGGGMAMPMEMPVWTGKYFLLMFLMWSIMMAGMMIPSVTPTVLIYAAVARKAAGQNSPVAPAGVFLLGYLIVWTAFSLAATASQFILDRAALLSPMMVSTSPLLGAGILVGAGVYQFLPYKKSCLKNCRSPIDFIVTNWKKGRMGALRMGIEHGWFCLGCCWVLMLLLFVGGVMNLFWIALITVFVLLEKVLPLGDIGGRVIGAVMIVSGALLMIYGAWGT